MFHLVSPFCEISLDGIGVLLFCVVLVGFVCLCLCLFGFVVWFFVVVLVCCVSPVNFLHLIRFKFRISSC